MKDHVDKSMGAVTLIPDHVDTDFCLHFQKTVSLRTTCSRNKDTEGKTPRYTKF